MKSKFYLIFLLCALCATAIFAQPANNECANAISMSANVVYNGDIANATGSSPTTTCNGTASMDVWYKYYPQNVNTQSIIEFIPSSGFRGVLEIFDNSCNGNVVACGVASGNGENLRLTFTPSGSWHQYYIRVFHYSGSPSTTTFSIKCYQSNNECGYWNPQIPLTGAVFNSNTCGATESVSPITCNSRTASSAPDVWYYLGYVNGNYRLTVQGSANFDPVVELRSGSCNGTSVSCSDATTNGGLETITFTGNGSTPYYFRVYDYSGHASNIISDSTTFAIRCQLACIPQVTLTSPTNNKTLATNAAYDWAWSATGSGNTYKINIEGTTYTSVTSPTSKNTGTGNPTTSPYTWYVVATNTCGKDSSSFNYYRLPTLTPSTSWQQTDTVSNGSGTTGQAYFKVHMTSGQRYIFTTCNHDHGRGAGNGWADFGAYNTWIEVTDGNFNSFSSPHGCMTYNGNWDCGGAGKSSYYDYICESTGDYIVRVACHNIPTGCSGRFVLGYRSATGPASPGTIAGNTTVCAGSSQVYSVTNTSGLTYTWSLPTGWTQTAGGTTNSITVTAGTSGGTITCTPSECSTNGTSSTLSVNVGTTGFCCTSPAVITPDSICDPYTDEFAAGQTGYWLSFTADTTFYEISLLSSEQTPVANIRQMNVYNPDCDSLQLLYSRNKDNGDSLFIRFENLTQGKSYLVNLINPSGSSGFFTVCMQKVAEPEYNYAINPEIICIGDSFKIDSWGETFGVLYEWHWFFNGAFGLDSIVSLNLDTSFWVQATTAGYYTIDVAAHRYPNYLIDTVFHYVLYIDIKPNASTSFTYTPLNLACGDSVICFNDTTVGVRNYFIQFQNPPMYWAIYDYYDTSIPLWDSTAYPNISFCHTFPPDTGRTFIVELIANGFCGVDTFRDTITFKDPFAFFTSDAPVCFGDSVHFTDSTECPMFWNWNFGDGHSGNSQNPVHLYQNPGNYLVTLTTDTLGTSYADTITVLQPPVIDISGDGNNCEILETYYVRVYDSLYTYYWGFSIDSIINPINSNFFNVNWSQLPDGGYIYFEVTDNSIYGCKNIDSIYVNGCCIKANADVSYIDSILPSDTALDNKIITINGYLYLYKGDSILWTGDTVYLAPNAKIVIQDSSYLFIGKNSVLTTCSGKMWDGIYVEGPNASLEISSSIIENAKNSVVLNSGGKLGAYHSKFRNNYKSIVVNNYNGPNYPTYFKLQEDTIICNDTLLPQVPPVTAIRTKYGIEVNKVNNIEIGLAGLVGLRNVFINMDIGIKCFSSKVSVFNNKFIDIEEPANILRRFACAAIYSTARKSTFSTGLIVGGNDDEKNYFYNCTNGVYSYNNKSFTITNNVFDYSNNSLNRGTAIHVAEIWHSTGTKIISYDSITSYRNGIVASGINNLNINWNRIYDLKAPINSSPLLASYGIRFTNAANSIVRSNLISNSATGDWRIQGISFDYSPSSTVTCNNMYHMGKSMFAGGPSYPSKIQKNLFEYGVDGFFLNWGIVGTQGDSSHAQDNQWTGTFSHSQMNSYNSNGSFSRFYAKYSSSYWPSQNILECPSGLSTCDTIPLWLTSGNSNAHCTNPIFKKWAIDTLQLDSIANGEIFITDDTLGSIWLVQQGLYKHLILNDTVRTDTIIQQFQDESDTADIGHFEIINGKLADGDYIKAADILDEISGTQTPVRYLKTTYTILIDALQSRSENADELNFNSEQIDTLRSIAEQCPYYYGDAVYMARMLLCSIDTTEYINTCEIPEYQNGQKIKHDKQLENFVNSFAVYPNPAMDMITIINSSNEPAILEIYNYLGKKLSSSSINMPVNQLNVKELSSGIYIYRIVNSKGVCDTDRLMILK